MGNPVPSVIRVIDEEYKELSNLPTAENGYFELTVPGREILSVSVSPFVGLPQHYIEIEGGFRISRYFELTKTITATGDKVEVDFVLPPAGALWIVAYSPECDKMLMGNFTSQVFPDAWYQQVYGAFPLGNITVPTGTSVGQLRAAWHPQKEWSQWEPYFAVSPNEPVYLTMLWPVPSMGTIWLRADNEGQGYNLGADEVRNLNIVYEFAKTEYRQAVQIEQGYENHGYSFSSEVTGWLSLACDNLNQAKQQADEKNQALLSYEVLELSIKAKEKMVLEAAELGIEGRGETFIISLKDEQGEPVPGANVTYKQATLDFIKGYGIQALEGATSPSVKAGREMGFDYLYKGDLSWGEVEAQQGVYDFSKIDSYLDRAGMLGYKVVVGLLWLGGGTDGVTTWKNIPDWAENLEFPEFRQELYQFTRKTVEHLGGKVEYLSLAVEPELFTRIGSRYVSVDFESDYTRFVNIEELIQLTKTVYQAAKDAGSGVLLGYSMSPCYNYYHINPTPFGSPPPPYYLLKLMLENGVQPDFIGVESHYGTIQPPVDLSTLVSIIQDFHAFSKLPVLLEEMSSYSSRTEDYGIPAKVYWHEGMTQKAQTEWDTGVFKIAMGLPYVLGVQMVHMDPDNPPEWGLKLYAGTMIGTDFLTQDNKPKQVYYAMKQLFDSWAAQGSATTDAHGEVSLKGFSGNYSIRVTTREGLLHTFETHLDHGSNVVTLTLDRSKT
jgi:hypothetical protein